MVKVGTVLSIMFVEHEYCFQKQIVRKNSHKYVKFQKPPPPNKGIYKIPFNLSLCFKYSFISFNIFFYKYAIPCFGLNDGFEEKKQKCLFTMNCKKDFKW